MQIVDLTLSDFTQTLNHLNTRMTRIEQEISDSHIHKKSLLFIHQQKQMDDHIKNLQLEYNTLHGVFKYMTNLKGVL